METKEITEAGGIVKTKEISDTKKSKNNEIRPFWTKLFAVVSIIFGIFYCLTLVLLPIGIPIIMASSKLFSAAHFGDLYSKSKDSRMAEESMKNFFNVFSIWGKTVLISTLVIIPLSLIFLIVFAVLAATQTGY